MSRRSRIIAWVFLCLGGLGFVACVPVGKWIAEAVQIGGERGGWGVVTFVPLGCAILGLWAIPMTVGAVRALRDETRGWLALAFYSRLAAWLFLIAGANLLLWQLVGGRLDPATLGGAAGSFALGALAVYAFRSLRADDPSGWPVPPPPP